MRPPSEALPDVRDGLSRIERVILYELHRAQADFGERPVPLPADHDVQLASRPYVGDDVPGLTGVICTRRVQER